MPYGSCWLHAHRRCCWPPPTCFARKWRRFRCFGYCRFLSIFSVSFCALINPRWYQRSIFHPLFGVCLFLICAAFDRRQHADSGDPPPGVALSRLHDLPWRTCALEAQREAAHFVLLNYFRRRRCGRHFRRHCRAPSIHVLYRVSVDAWAPLSSCCWSAYFSILLRGSSSVTFGLPAAITGWRHPRCLPWRPLDCRMSRSCS